MPYPGPALATNASSPMKKSRSSVPRLADNCDPGPAPPVRKEGLLATAGLPDPDPPPPAAEPFVAIAVGKTKEGESLPANPGIYISRLIPALLCGLFLPSLENPVPLQHVTSVESR